MNFYKTGKWKRKRAVILRRDEYMCRDCKRYGKTTQAVTVHHVIPLVEDVSLSLINNNLISLCNTCHEAMHDRLNDELTPRGKAWVDRLWGSAQDQAPLKSLIK